MTPRAFSLVATVLFSFIALAHLVRLVLDVSWLAAGRLIPMWASLVGVLLAVFMAYQSFRLST